MHNIESWRLKNERYQLKGTETAGKPTFPPRIVEPRQVERYDFAEEKNIEVAFPIISELAAAAD